MGFDSKTFKSLTFHESWFKTVLKIISSILTSDKTVLKNCLWNTLAIKV